MAITLDEAKTLCEEIRADYALRDTANRAMEDMFLLKEPSDLPDADWIKRTLSPDARNALQGAVRLLTAADPKWSVPEEMNESLADGSSDMEKLADAIWQAAGRVQGRPRHYDAVLAGLLYGECIIVPTCTKDLLDAASGGLKKRYEDVAAQTPLLFDAINPRQAYPVYDGQGLAAFHSFRKMKVRDIIQRWPKAEAILGSKKGTDTEEIGEYWDYDNHYVWIQSGGELWNDKNEWGFIPVAAGITEGSDLFTESDQHTRQPFLYTLWRSKLWERQNLGLTLMYSFAMGVLSNPMFTWTSDDPERALPVDYSTPGGTMKLKTGETFQPLAKQVLDPSLMQAFEVANDKGIESTIYRQALGEPLGANAPFSMVAMLSQAGRLPLIPYQRMISHVIGDAMSKGLRMVKLHGEAFRVRDKKALVEIDAGQLPEAIEIEATLDIQMPQDQQAQAQTALALAGGDAPLMSKETARKRFLNLEQPEEEEQKIFNEQAMMLRMMQYFQQEAMMMQQGQQMPMDQSVPPELMQQYAQNPEAQTMMGMQPGGMPNPMSTGAQPGMPGTPLPGPLPSEGEMPA